MSPTKRRILAASLTLLNERGLANVSQRDICQQLDMSPGNLTYHFKKKADIIEALYQELVAKTNAQVAALHVSDNALVGMYRAIHTLIEHFYTYRFIFNDFLHVMRDHPGIREHYQGLLSLRLGQFGLFLTSLVEQGYLRPAELPREYERLSLRQAVLADFWFSHAVFHPEDYGVQQCSTMLTESLYPYLTAKGKRVYEEELVPLFVSARDHA